VHSREPGAGGRHRREKSVRQVFDAGHLYGRLICQRLESGVALAAYNPMLAIGVGGADAARGCLLQKGLDLVFCGRADSGRRSLFQWSDKNVHRENQIAYENPDF